MNSLQAWPVCLDGWSAIIRSSKLSYITDYYGHGMSC